MKRQNLNLNIDRFLKTIILAVVVLSFSSAAQAQVASDDPSTREISVKYVGADEQRMLVAVKYNNLSSSKFVLSIYNQDGDVVFRNTYTTKDFQKTFSIPRENGKLNFVFLGVHDKLSRSYTIHSSSRTVEDVLVTRVD